VETKKAPILSEKPVIAFLDVLQEVCDRRLISSPGVGTEDADADEFKSWLLDPKTSLPEQLFADSHLRLTHTKSGAVIDFNALDALRSWQSEPEPTVHVPGASEWLKSREQDVKATNAVTLHTEWCAKSGVCD
jgi:TIP41-like family